MNLVVGATGYLGGEICRRLADAGRAVRGLTRSSSAPEAVAALADLGIEAARGDLKDRASLVAACSGIDTVFSTVTSIRSRAEGDSFSSVDELGQMNLVDAAREAGCRRFIYVSVMGSALSCPLVDAKRAVEDVVRSSDLDFTILRPTFFMEVWLGPHVGFDFAHAKAHIYGSGEQPVSWISQSDVARIAVACVEEPTTRHATVELGGPQALSPLAVVEIFEEESGRGFDVEHVSEDALEAQLAAAEDEQAKTFAALMLTYARGDRVEPGRTPVPLDQPLVTVRDYARRAVVS